MRVLVTGATGLLGPYLMNAAAGLGTAIGLARRNADVACELANADAVSEAIRQTRPDVVVHAAAMTSVDACEADPAAATRANELATRNLATALPPSTRLVCISTDQVYPDTPGEKAEGQEAPVNVYGSTKLAGERAALQRNNTLVLRCNLFGPSLSPERASLSDWIASSLAAGRRISLFTDVFFSPLHMSTLSHLVFEAAARGLRGTYNLGCRAGASKSEFGRLVAARLGLSTASAADGVSTAVPGRARRPADLRLDVRRIEGALDRTMPTLAEEVERL